MMERVCILGITVAGIVLTLALTLDALDKSENRKHQALQIENCMKLPNCTFTVPGGSK